MSHQRFFLFQLLFVNFPRIAFNVYSSHEEMSIKQFEMEKKRIAADQSKNAEEDPYASVRKRAKSTPDYKKKMVPIVI